MRNFSVPLVSFCGKIQDIRNRGGGELVIEVYNSSENKELADTPHRHRRYLQGVLPETRYIRKKLHIGYGIIPKNNAY